MQSVVGDLDNDVRYLVDRDGEVDDLSRPPVDGSVMGVEMHYYCPNCDCPNVVAYTTPVPDGCVDECDYCDEVHDITLASEGDGREHYSAEDFEDIAIRLKRQREARLAGERTPEEYVTRLLRLRTVAQPFRVLAHSVTYFGVLFGIIGVATGVLAGELAVFSGSIGVIVAFALFSAGIEKVWNRLHARYLTSDDDIDAEQLASNFNHVRRALDVQRGEADLYIPEEKVPDESQKRGSVERELV